MPRPFFPNISPTMLPTETDYLHYLYMFRIEFTVVCSWRLINKTNSWMRSRRTNWHDDDQFVLPISWNCRWFFFRFLSELCPKFAHFQGKSWLESEHVFVPKVVEYDGAVPLQKCTSLPWFLWIWSFLHEDYHRNQRLKIQLAMAIDHHSSSSFFSFPSSYSSLDSSSNSYWLQAFLFRFSDDSETRRTNVW